jgi:superfamily II DNA or RNA helicase
MLQIFVTHNIRIRGASTPLRAAIMSALTVDNPEFLRRAKKKQPTWGIDRRLQLYAFDQGDIIAPRGFWRELCGILLKQGINPEKVTTKRLVELPPIDFGPWNTECRARPYQEPALAAALQHDGTLVMPAGAGKTFVGMRYIWERKQPALWLVHTMDLADQAIQAARKYMPGVGNIGYFGGGERRWGDGKLFVAIVDTLDANPDLVDTLNTLVGTVVVDEAHHFPARKFIETVGRFAAKNLLGLTATPDRKDGLQPFLFAGIGPVCYEVPREALYESGSLIKPDVRFVYTDFDLETASDRTDYDNVDAGGEDIDYVGLLQALTEDEKRAKLVAEKILEAAKPGCYQIVLTESVRYCYKLRDLVAQLAHDRYGPCMPRMAVVHSSLTQYVWYKARNERDARERVARGEAVDVRLKNGRWEVKVARYTDEEMRAWQISPAERREIIAAAKAKQIDILFATQLAREGLDMPHLNVGHMAMPKRGDTGNARDGAALEQEIGRIMRADPSNPNKRATWYDYVDYNVGIFKDQYYSRRKVYKRLGLKVPPKPRDEQDEIMSFMNSGLMFDLPY